MIVLAGGGPPPLGARLPDRAPVIAADSGLDQALALGVRVDLAVGDFDSASSKAIGTAEAQGVRFERHSVVKDATDLELALEAAVEMMPRRILVLGPAGGRLDHLIACVLALGWDRLAGFEVDALLGGATIHAVRTARRLEGTPGELLTLMAVNGPAVGVVTEGLSYPLRGETLEPGSSRGVSNVFAAPEARVALERGVLLVIRPGSAERGIS